MPVAGLLQPTARREQVAASVPANGPVARISGFSGASASVPGGSSSNRIAQQQALAAHEEPRPLRVERLDRGAKLREIEPQYVAGIEIHRVSFAGVASVLAARATCERREKSTCRPG